MEYKRIFFNKEFRGFCIYRLIFGISYSIMIPIIPLFFKSVGMTTVVIGMIISGYGVSKTIIQLPFGIVTDKIGDKFMLVISLFLMGLIPISYMFADKSFSLGLIYVLQGAILGMAAPATYSVLARTLDKANRGKCTGLAAAVFTLGGGIGAAIAGIILEKTNNFSITFYISAIGIFISLFYVVLKIKKVKKENEVKSEGIKTIIKEIRKSGFTSKIIILSASSFLGDFIYSCVVALIHFYGQDVLGVSTMYTSSIISVYLLVFGLGAPLAGYVSDLVGNRKQFLFSFIIMDLALLGLIITRNISLFTIIIVIYFLGATFLNGALQNSLSQFGDYNKIKGLIFGIVGASESLGYAVGPLITAHIYNFNNNYLFLVLLIVSVLVSVVYLIFFKNASI